MLDPFEGMKQDIERTHARRQRQWEFSMKMAFGSMVGMTLIITYLIIMNILGWKMKYVLILVFLFGCSDYEYCDDYTACNYVVDGEFALGSTMNNNICVYPEDGDCDCDGNVVDDCEICGGDGTSCVIEE